MKHKSEYKKALIGIIELEKINMNVLITGASGFIGKALSVSMSKKHNVICMSRKDPKLDLTYIRGEFSSFEDLRQLDKYDIDVVVHLGAVTGRCLERDGILVNVEGTRCLMRYLIDKGCKKFVLASSIAAVGAQDKDFQPIKLPIPDNHPCLDKDGYGLSKYLMEEVSKYYQRQNPDLDVINLRLSSVLLDEHKVSLTEISPPRPWCICRPTVMHLSDAIKAFTLAAESKHKPGLRIMNACGPKAWVAVPVADILYNWWGDDVDLSYFKQPGNEYASIYDVKLIKKELGFVAELTP